MILITAAGGKVGQPLVEQLSAQHIPARAGFRSAEKAQALRLPDIETAVLDLEKPETLDAALRGIEKVFLVSAGSPSQPAQERNVIEAAKKAGIKHVVKLSAMAADQEKFSFGRWNRAGELALEHSGLPWTLLRPNMFDQDMLGMAGLIKDKGGFSMGLSSTKSTPIDARDIAAAAVVALTREGHAGKAYALNGPEVLSNAEQAAIFSQVLGKPIQHWDTPIPEWRKGLEGSGMPAWMVTAFVDMMEWYPTEPQLPLADTEKLIGRPAIRFAQFVRDHLAAFN